MLNTLISLKTRSLSLTKTTLNKTILIKNQTSTSGIPSMPSSPNRTISLWFMSKLEMRLGLKNHMCAPRIPSLEKRSPLELSPRDVNLPTIAQLRKLGVLEASQENPKFLRVHQGSTASCPSSPMVKSRSRITLQSWSTPLRYLLRRESKEISIKLELDLELADTHLGEELSSMRKRRQSRLQSSKLRRSRVGNPHPQRVSSQREVLRN